MKVPFLFSALLALTALGVHADEIKRVALDGVTPVVAPVEEAGQNEIDLIHKIETPALELFPAAGGAHHGTVLIFPGGGYGVLAVRHEGRTVARMLNDAGWDAAVLLYHVSAGPKTREMALEEAKLALALLQEKSATLGLSAAKIGVMGFSAGGHLAARLTHETAGGHPPTCQVLIYPAYLDKDGEVLEEVAPSGVPTFECVAADDQFHTGAVAYEAACRKAGTRCELHYPLTGGHGFGLRAGLPDSVKDWPEQLKTFLGSL